MEMSRMFPPTLREVGDKKPVSHKLLLQAGLIRQVSAGVYSIMPLAFLSLQKIRQIILDEMSARGVLNLELCIIQPQDLWEKTGRWQGYQDSKTMFVTTERHSGNKFGLAPTAEEVVTSLIADHVTGAGQLPIHLHQIGPKFRDEIRPRFGLLRTREFEMSDAYSFDLTEQEMHRSFQMYREIYERIFSRVGLNNFISVQADSGAIGGQGSAEFMAISDTGEDLLLTCNTCDYGANIEKAGCLLETPEVNELCPMRKEPTPNIRTVEELGTLFGMSSRQMMKTIIFWVDDSYPVAVCMRGDLKINEVKVRNVLGASSVEAAPDHIVREVTDAPVGFAGPIGLKVSPDNDYKASGKHMVKRILFDTSIKGLTNLLCGCNEEDVHLLDVNFGRDLPMPEEFYELHTAQAGYTCPQCKVGVLQENRGIETGHVFMLQTGYSQAMGAFYQDEHGERQPIWMGCYGIGTTRLLQAVVEQNHDDKGIIWPESVAPYHIHIIPIQASNETHMNLASELYKKLMKKGLSVVLDDRDTSAGVKFNDADLIGFPWRVTIGRDAPEGLVEIRDRRTGKTKKATIKEAISFFYKQLKPLL